MSKSMSWCRENVTELCGTELNYSIAKERTSEKYMKEKFPSGETFAVRIEDGDAYVTVAYERNMPSYTSWISYSRTAPELNIEECLYDFTNIIERYMADEKDSCVFDEDTKPGDKLNVTFGNFIVFSNREEDMDKLNVLLPFETYEQVDNAAD